MKGRIAPLPRLSLLGPNNVETIMELLLLSEAPPLSTMATRSSLTYNTLEDILGKFDRLRWEEQPYAPDITEWVSIPPYRPCRQG